MKPPRLQDLVQKTWNYKQSLFCLSASCCCLLTALPQEAGAAPGRKKNAAEVPDRVKRQVEEISDRMVACDSRSMLDRARAVPTRLIDEHRVTAADSVLFTGTDACPGTNIPAGTSFSDSGTTVGATSTISIVNTGCVETVSPGVFYTTVAGPDHIYRFVLPALGSRIPTCTITATPSAGYDLSLYYVTVGGGGCPNGTGNTVTNCFRGQDAGFGGVAETISDAKMDSTPAGQYFLFIDSYYAAGAPSAGSYTLNFNCTTLAVVASVAQVGGRVTGPDGRGLGKVW